MRVIFLFIILISVLPYSVFALSPSSGLSTLNPEAFNEQENFQTSEIPYGLYSTVGVLGDNLSFKIYQTPVNYFKGERWVSLKGVELPEKKDIVLEGLYDLNGLEGLQSPSGLDQSNLFYLGTYTLPPGLEMYAGERLYIYDSNCNVIRELSEPFSYDSSGNSVRCKYVLKDKISVAGTGSINANPDMNTKDLFIYVPEEWLFSDERTYPIVIDPILSSVSNQDAHISYLYPYYNYGYPTTLYAYQWFTNNYYRILMSWNLPQNPPVPGDSTIISAKLNLYCSKHDRRTSTEYTLDVHNLLRDFDENTATWYKADSSTNWDTPGGDYDPIPIDSVSPPQEGKWSTFWLAGDGADNPFDIQWGQPLNLLIKGSRDGEQLLVMDEFVSKEATSISPFTGADNFKPYLEVIYGISSVTVTNITVDNVTSSSATIKWKTNEPSDSLIQYGTSSGVYTYEEYDSSWVYDHQLIVGDLIPEQQYFFKVRSSIGNITGESAEEHFLTLAINEVHPGLLFFDITLTPGYVHRSESPWNSWESGILSGTDIVNKALAYQITGDTGKAESVKSELLTFTIPDSAIHKVWKLREVCLAYDFIQPYLSLNSADEAIIRGKIAQLADGVYYDLNDGGKDMGYISTVDYHLQAYPIMGIAGCTLSDYHNPALRSTPADWLKVGTDYLFEDDLLHNHGRSMIDFQVDDSGKDLLGAYKFYYIDDLILWAQVYSFYFDDNFLDRYPTAKELMLEEVWANLPNRYSSNYCTNENVLWSHHKDILNLLDSTNRSYVLRYLDSIDDSLLPYSRYFTWGSNMMGYLKYEGYQEEKKDPDWASHLRRDSVFQVFRAGWEADSDWLSFITWAEETGTNRNMMHHDQLSFEYYGKGDLLVADIGEVKSVLDKQYGGGVFGHNVLLVGDPRSPFSTGGTYPVPWRGVYKGSSYNLVTPAVIRTMIGDSSLTELVEGEAVIDYIDSSVRLSSPIEHSRTVIFPKDYFVIVDRAEGAESWEYQNLLHLSSLMVTPSTGSTEGLVGHVNGDLKIGVGGVNYDWIYLPYKSLQDIGDSNTVKWETTNPYGEDVELTVFTSPLPDLSIMKHTLRIGGGDRLETNVYHPVLFMGSGESEKLNRITVLKSRYSTDEEITFTELAVTGDGRAVKIQNSTRADYVYSGYSGGEFENITTDSELLFMRVAGSGVQEFTMLRGSYVDIDNVYSSSTNLVSADKPVEYLSLKYGDSGDEDAGDEPFVKMKVNCSADNNNNTKITIFGLNSSKYYKVIRDGYAHKDWLLKTNGTSESAAELVVNTSGGEHTFEVIEGPMVAPTDASGTPKDGFLNEPVFVKGMGFPPNEMIDIHITEEGEWTEGTYIGSFNSTSVLTDSEGGFLAIIWDMPIEGDYDIVADAARDGIFDISEDAVVSVSIQGNVSGTVTSTQIEISNIGFGDVVADFSVYYYVKIDGSPGDVQEGYTAEGIREFAIVDFEEDSGYVEVGLGVDEGILGGSQKLPTGCRLIVDDDPVPEGFDVDENQIILIGEGGNATINYGGAGGDNKLVFDADGSVYVFLNTGSSVGGDVDVDLVLTAT